MKTLSDIEIEDILAGHMPMPEDIDEASRRRMEHARSLQARLHDAGQAIIAPPALAGSIRAALDEAPDEAPSHSLHMPAVLRRFAPALAAAAMVTLAIGLWFIVGGTSQAYAQPELAAIHETNVAHGNDFVPCLDGTKIARRMQKQTGRDIHMPTLPASCRFAGSTLARFRDTTVASAVLETETGPVSIITIRDPAESLGFTHTRPMGARTFYTCHHDNCRMAAVNIDGLTFIATGEADHERLIHLLQTFAKAQSPQE